MCGLPGGIDYFLLALVKLKLIASLTEKRINVLLNLVIRWPFQLLSMYVIFLNFAIGNFSSVPWQLQSLMILAIVSHGFNAVYYARKVTGNYFIKMQAIDKEKAAKYVTGE